MVRRATSHCLFLLTLSFAFSGAALSQDVVVGANVNMVSGADFPDGDPFQRQQNEPSVAFSSRNNLHLLAGANDYRAVDVPGLPGGRETGDSWLSYFWSTNGGATWKSTLIPGYPQDPACQGPNPPTLCGYAAGADPVVRAGVNGMFYYSGIVFERTDPTRSAIFVSRFIDLNNDEGGDPIRYIDTVLLDTNDDGAEFLDKSWIGVDIPRAGASSKTFSSVEQRDGTPASQTVLCGNLHVGYAAIAGESSDLRSEIRLATSTDCGDSWNVQLISQPNTLNQGASVSVDPLTGDVHVGWRRFDTVEAFLGVPSFGCPRGQAYWKSNPDEWPVDSLTLGDVVYTKAEALMVLNTPPRGDVTITLARHLIVAKLNLLTGGGVAENGTASLTVLVDKKMKRLSTEPEPASGRELAGDGPRDEPGLHTKSQAHGQGYYDDDDNWDDADDDQYDHQFPSNFDPARWARRLGRRIERADHYLTLNPVGSAPRKRWKKRRAYRLTYRLQRIYLGSGDCVGGGIAGGTTGETNAIVLASSYDQDRASTLRSKSLR